MENWKLIRQIARDLGVHDYAISKWKVRGVPHKYRMRIILLAADVGVVIEYDDMGEAE